MKTKLLVIFLCMLASLSSIAVGGDVHENENTQAGVTSFRNVPLVDVLSTLNAINESSDFDYGTLKINPIGNGKLKRRVTIKDFRGDYKDLLSHIADTYDLELFAGSDGNTYLSDRIQYSFVRGAESLADEFPIISDASFVSLTLPTRAAGENYGVYLEQYPDLAPVLLELKEVPSSALLKSLKDPSFIGKTTFFLTSQDSERSDVTFKYFGGTINSLKDEGLNALVLYVDASILKRIDSDGKWTMNISFFDKALEAPKVLNLGQLLSVR